MGHNSVISSHPKSTGIPRVDVLSTGPPDLGCHTRTKVHCLDKGYVWVLKRRDFNENPKEDFSGNRRFRVKEASHL